MIGKMDQVSSVRQEIQCSRRAGLRYSSWGGVQCQEGGKEPSHPLLGHHCCQKAEHEPGVLVAAEKHPQGFGLQAELRHRQRGREGRTWAGPSLHPEACNPESRLLPESRVSPLSKPFLHR